MTMRNVIFTVMISLLLVTNACNNTNEALDPSAGSRARVASDFKIDWTQWITKGFSWRINNIDGTTAIISPLKFIGKDLPIELKTKSATMNLSGLNGLVNLVTTYKGASVVSKEILIDLPSKYQLKESIQIASPGAKFSQTACTDHYYQTCFNGSCAEKVFNYRSCVTIEYDFPVTNTPMPAVTGTGGSNDGLTYSTTGSHETNQTYFIGKIQCYSFSVRNIPLDQMPGNTRFECGVNNFAFTFSDKRRVTLSGVYISFNKMPNGIPYSRSQAATLLANAADAAALQILAGYDNPANSVTFIKTRFMQALKNHINSMTNTAPGSPDEAEVRDWSATDQARGLNMVNAFYVQPNMAYAPCYDTPD